MLLLNLKIARRNLLKNKGFSLINIGGLSIGLACCLLLLLYVNYEWSYDKQFKDIDRIYFVKTNLVINGQLKTEDYTTNRIAEKALTEPNSIVLTTSSAKKLFGNINPIGQTLKWDNRRQLKVSGVIENPPGNQTFQFEALQNWNFYVLENPDHFQDSWGSITIKTVFKLKASKNFANIDASLRKLLKSNDKTVTNESFLFPFSKYHLYNEFENGKPAGGRIDQVKLFILLAFSVLIIASINYMNLSTARSEKRKKEVGVRKVLGAKRSTLAGQFLMESLLLSTISMFVAFAMVEYSLPYFNGILNIHMQLLYHSPIFWSFLILLILFTGLLAGSYPAFYLSSFTPIKVLNGTVGKGSLSIRQVLVIVQFSLSICMIICAIVIYTQIQFMKNKPMGFDQNNLVQLDIEGELTKTEKLELFKKGLISSGSVISATEFSGPFTEGGSMTSDLIWPGKSVNDNTLFDYRSTGFGFSKTTGAKILMGRDFSPEFKADTSTSILLNRAAANVMSLKNPVGTVIRWAENPPVKIIGIVEDYSNEAWGNKSVPTVFYVNLTQTSVLLLRLNPHQSLSTAVQSIKKINQQLNPAFPPDLQFISQTMDEKLINEKLLSILSNLFGGFAILISCLGLLGLALYMAEQRNKEISIRKVLGADLKSILILLNKDFIKLVFLSNIIAFPAAYVLCHNWLQKYDYSAGLTVWPFLTAAILSIAIALLTVSIQSFKVAKANAADALKYE
ncbi:FtsX-like permease family protein [Pedobacter sp. PAMC26386]|nr:FtsX-like permease family protein [Pedobacter sp. PAMC26386]